MKLPPNDIYVKNEEFGTIWIYTVDPEDLEILEKRGKKDEEGNLVLSFPYIAALKRFVSEKVLENIENYMQEEINVPNIPKPELKGKLQNISNYSECTNQELEKFLITYGGYKAYLDSQLAYITSKKGVLEAFFEEGLNKMMYTLSQQEREKRATKEILRGEALVNNPLLKKTRQDLIELEGIFSRISGQRDAYKALFDTVSRVISIRTLDGRKES